MRAKLPWLLWPARARVYREPFGVACIVGPWNYPLQLLLMPMVSAIAAGNCVIVKPSELAPHTSKAIASLIESTFPPDYIVALQGGRETTEAVLDAPPDFIFFTGGGQVGAMIMERAAHHLTPVALELGGKCPCVVCADAPLELAARRIAWGKFLNAGATCVAPDHVLVDAQVHDAFLDAIKGAIGEFFGADPQQSPFFGRIVNRHHFDRLVDYLRFGEIVIGGRSDAAARYIAPTVLRDTPADAPVMQEEIFGPILPVVAVRDIDEAIERIGALPAPLAVYLFTGDRRTHKRFVEQTRSGAMCINDTVVQTVPSTLGFGGVGASGFGRYHGRAGFDCFSYTRPVVVRSTWIDPRFRYPPSAIGLDKLRRVYKFLLGG